jgi:hypothetical protein
MLHNRQSKSKGEKQFVWRSEITIPCPLSRSASTVTQNVVDFTAETKKEGINCALLFLNMSEVVSLLSCV